MCGCAELGTAAADERAPSLEESSDPVVVVARDRRIAANNHSFQEHLGYADGELVGRPIDSLVVTPVSLELPPSRIRFVRDVQVIDRSGARQPAELVLCPDHDSTVFVVRLSTVIRDEDVAEIVHDLKNPLSTISLDAQLLDGEVAACDHVARIERNVQFMDRLVHELLDLCSIDHGQFVVHRKMTELRELVERVVSRAVPGAHRHRVVLDAPVHVVVACDEVRIERVVANLLDNALKYTHPQHSIVLQLSVTATHACIAVIDRGPGIPSAELATLFEKYRRGSASCGHPGSGIGLYVSRKIVEAHGGRIAVESAPAPGPDSRSNCRFRPAVVPPWRRCAAPRKYVLRGIPRACVPVHSRTRSRRFGNV